ncbi:hypothetical protein [Limnoglobus roseus]|uniref:Uncharacterized protein n=1 Tax=Limnoglobus roseus TaxID=2598579 RepID=A0A5C1ADG5_9BACT|nr:hypothetical protein [Limnoglobus roseus]QEL17399.1 hypothetical protein PX52LOC_04387 [Limnoglobus roseus]
MGNEIEGRLLARQTVEEISEIQGIAVGVVEAYEAVFFHVRDRLDNVSWFVNCVLGQQFHDGLKPRDWAKMWKLYAYFGGPLMLDVFVRKNGITWVNDAGQVKFSMAADTQHSLAYKSLIAGRTLSISSFTDGNVMDLMMRNTDLQHRLSLGQADEIAASLEGILKSFCYAVIDASESTAVKTEPRTVGLLANTPVEDLGESDPFKREGQPEEATNDAGNDDRE